MAKTFQQQWQMKTKVSNHTYENIDFTGIDFNHPIFENVIFRYCTFAKCNLDDTRLYGCDFYGCVFDKVDLRGATIGCYDGDFIDCTFKQCDFRRSGFYSPEFINCLFDKCKWQGCEPHASYFENCKIIGKLMDISFYNYFENDYIQPKRKELFHSIDFSEAIFCEYVTFEQCDLSKSIPPNGRKFADILTETFPSRIKHGVTCIGTGEYYGKVSSVKR